MSFHKDVLFEDNHGPFRYEFADTVARLAGTGYTAAQLAEGVAQHKWAYQLDTKEAYILVTSVPLVWVSVGSAFAHVIASHTDTSATGAELNELTGGGTTTLHSHTGAISFGTEFLQVSDSAESSTTAITPNNKLNLTTGTIPAGTYRVAVYFEWINTDNNIAWIGKLEHNNITALLNWNMSVKREFVDGRWHGMSGYAYTTLTNAIHTFDLDFWTENALGTSYIRNAKIEFWRVS